METKSSGGIVAKSEAHTEAEYTGEGKALIGKTITKKDTPGTVEEYDPETKLYKVRFEGDQTEEIKWEELQKYIPQEIIFKRFSQKKKEPSADQQDKPGEQSTNSEAATDSEDDVKAKNSDYEREARIQQVSNENAIVITQVQEVQRMEKMDMLADVVVQSKLEVVATKKRPRKSVAPVKLQQEVDAISSGEEADEEDEEDDEESHDEDSESLDSLSEDGSEDEPEIDSEDEDDDEEDEERDRKDGVDDDSDCSLNESDLERLRKKPKKKRKHVLTLQRWRGYKKKRRLAKQEGSDGTLAIKRQKRPKKPTPVDELTRRRQVIAAELKRKLKESCANLKRKKKKKKTVAVESIVEPSLVELSPAKLALPEPPEVLESPEPSPKSLEVATPSTAITSTNLNASESKPSPFDRGIKLRGRKLRKRFNGRVFRGEVADYDRRNRRYKVRYEDGDEEQLMWKDVGPLLVPFEELHTWDDPNYQPQQTRVISSELLAVEKKAREEKLKLPKLKPQVVKKERKER
ncbi:nucleolin-like [Selaginella moellendorffii]|uniref:nucleolin-like n=1 Tax=Selaginella moellendorffii TaxID=88036 RepID=UPI000D1C8A7D|nr:nucleolin-like [Selaginella moellendorffii]|eukprot:XP_024529319.1 nucleolin-like [Selaginella moellendorffii]